MKITKQQLRRMIKEQAFQSRSHLDDPLPDDEDFGADQGTAAQAAGVAYNSLLATLTDALEDAREMREFNQLAGPASAEVFGGTESLEISSAFERIWEACGFTEDGSTLKEYL